MNENQDTIPQESELQVQKMGKGMFIHDSAVTRHMASDLTGAYDLQRIQCSVTI